LLLCLSDFISWFPFVSPPPFAIEIAIEIGVMPSDLSVPRELENTGSVTRMFGPDFDPDSDFDFDQDAGAEEYGSVPEC